MISEYRTQCIMGRQLALAHLQIASETSNLPEFARRIREAAEDRTGLSVGYLFQLGEVALHGHAAGIANAADED